MGELKTKTGGITTFELVLMALLIALTVISARINLAIGPAPLTMQTLVVILSGMLLRPGLSWMAPAIYLAMGLIGLPFFTAGGGIGYLFHPTFGFLIGFIPAAPISYAFSGRRFFRNQSLNIMVGAVAGVSLIYLCGLAYIPFAAKFYGTGWAVWTVVLGTLPFMLIGEAIKIAVVSAIVPVIRKELEEAKGYFNKIN